MERERERGKRERKKDRQTDRDFSYWSEANLKVYFLFLRGGGE